MKKKRRAAVAAIFSAMCAVFIWWFFQSPVLLTTLPNLQTEQAELPGEAETEESKQEKSALHVVGLDDTIRFDEVENHISECVHRLQVDFDGDDQTERLCFRKAWIRADQCRTPFNALIVDVFKDKKWVLRQQMKQGVFYEERFFLVKDLDNDGTPELITRLQLSPDCAGCAAYAVYVFTEGSFVVEMNLFGISPHSRQVARVFRNRAGIRDTIDRRYRIELSADNPCGFAGKSSHCANDALWLLDSDGDGRVEVFQLLDPPQADFDYRSDSLNYRMFLMELPAKGIEGRHRFHFLKIDDTSGDISLLGFLQFNDGRVHALFNYGHPGTSTAYPILNVFEVKGIGLKRIAEFYGFYSHVVPDRLWDVNGDGNTEIIHVSSEYWPPGKSHADVILEYEIMEYKNGTYAPAGPGISDMAILSDEMDVDE